MNVSQVMQIALTLISKREEIAGVLKDAVLLFKRIKVSFPDLANQLEGLAGTATAEPAAPDFSVKWLQQSLNKLINAGLKVDGDYGKATHDAVKKFQQAYGLDVDGWAGAQTTAAILDALK